VCQQIRQRKEQKIVKQEFTDCFALSAGCSTHTAAKTGRPHLSQEARLERPNEAYTPQTTNTLPSYLCGTNPI
jgi:hypothetical protein